MTEVVRRWASNSAINVIGGLSAAAFNLLVPGIISRHLPEEQFAVWSLSLQIVAYVNLLGLGLQTAAARFIAQAHERQDRLRLQQTVRACQTISRFTAGLGLLLALALALLYPQAFPDLPPGLVGDFQWAVFFVGASSALQLLAMVPMGVYQGLHSNRSFVSVQILVRALTLILIAIGARVGFGLLALTALFSLGNLLLPLLLALRLTRQFDWVRGLASVKLDLALLRDLLSYCGTLSVWSISMLLVNSVGTLVVGRIAFHMTGAYSIALVAATVLAGLLGALLAPLLTTAAAMHAQESQRAGLPALLNRATVFSSLLLHGLFLCTLLFHGWVLQLWVGASYGAQAGDLLLILVGAHCLRNMAAPYALTLLATGLNRRALWTGVAEGLANLLATLALGLWLGVTGVALGTLVGAVVGILGSLLLNARKTEELTPRPGAFAFQGFVSPTLAFLPLHLAAAWYAGLIKL